MNFVLKVTRSKQNIQTGYFGIFSHGWWYLDGSDVNIQTYELENEFYIYHKKNNNDEQLYKIIVGSEHIKIIGNPFGISPIYYCETSDEIVVSSDINKIKENLRVNFKLNKKYLLEQNLFNYSFLNNTIYEQIKLAPSNEILKIARTLSFENYFNIEDYFCEYPISTEKCINEIVERFIELTQNKIHDHDYISFTGGFDGRSIVSLARYLGKVISVFSFGTETNDDLIIPKEQAHQLGIKYIPINLDSEEYLYEFWNLGQEIVKESCASTNFLQVHWPFSAKLIASKSNTIITGYFGSELFRAIHNTGQFTSKILIDYFRNIETDIWITKIQNASNLEFLNLENFKKRNTRNN